VGGEQVLATSVLQNNETGRSYFFTLSAFTGEGKAAIGLVAVEAGLLFSGSPTPISQRWFGWP